MTFSVNPESPVTTDDLPDPTPPTMPMTGGGAERTRGDGGMAGVIDGVDAGKMAVTARRQMGSGKAGLSIPFERAASVQTGADIMLVGGESVKLAVRRNCVFRGELSRILAKTERENGGNLRN